ncbi:hypothetical protein AYO40_05450 [Planctomycetaceae bacterium SCGC AG-212-D15]|nr:hypothetical protein AYO40_05450 [Planctomycetaceae bacterium SCGC AG-212-D15]
MECINLRERYGADFKITTDQSAETRDDPWMWQTPCLRGMIYPHGGDFLAVEVDYRAVTARKLAAIPGVVLHQDGDHEKTFLFPSELFDAVAAVVLPRRKRRLSPEQRSAAIGRLAAFQFQPHVDSAATSKDASGPSWQ